MTKNAPFQGPFRQKGRLKVFWGVAFFRSVLFVITTGGKSREAFLEAALGGGPLVLRGIADLFIPPPPRRRRQQRRAWGAKWKSWEFASSPPFGKLKVLFAQEGRWGISKRK